MKCVPLILLSGLLVVQGTGAALAQSEIGPSPRPAEAAPTTTLASQQYLDDYPAGAPISQPTDAQPQAVAPSLPLDSSNPGPIAGEECKPWTIPQPCFLQNLGIRMGGWLEQGFTANGWGSSNSFNGPLACNDLNEQYQLNQFWMFFDRPTDTQGCGWDIGGHVDLCYGTDWRYGRNYGLENRIDAANQYYGLVLPQFYLEVAYDDLKVKLGHFAYCLGYEVVPSPLNFFYSHSYALCYGDPILVTGLEADYKLNDNLTLVGGFNRGWMMFEDDNGCLDFAGGARWVSDDKETRLSFLTIDGPEDPAGQHNTFTYCLMYEEDVSKNMLYVIQQNLGVTQDGNPRDATQNAYWGGFVNYLLYKINPCWTAGLRFELFRDEEGSRVAGIGNWIGSDAGWTALPGFAGDFWELSAGLNWKANPNLTFRPELRYDWYDGTTNLQGVLPFNNGNSSTQLTLAADVILTF